MSSGPSLQPGVKPKQLMSAETLQAFTRHPFCWNVLLHGPLASHSRALPCPYPAISHQVYIYLTRLLSWTSSRPWLRLSPYNPQGSLSGSPQSALSKCWMHKDGMEEGRGNGGREGGNNGGSRSRAGDWLTIMLGHSHDWGGHCLVHIC